MNDFIVNSVLNERKLSGEISVPESYRKYFKTSKFFAYYDSDINADPSIINIPLLATILPLAWITGTDIQVNILDRRFKESMDKLQQDFKKIYPNAPFTTKIKAGKLTENKIGIKNSEISTALLFSGGVDSTYSLVNNLEHRPRLLMIWGVDNYPYPENKEQWNFMYSIYRDQAKRLGLPINLVKTNISLIMDTKRINHDFHKLLYNGSFRSLIQHSFILLPIMAPLSIGRFNKLLIASSAGELHDYTLIPWGSSPSIDEQIVWGDLDVRHDGAVDRTEKIIGIKTFLEVNSLLFKVCLRKLDRPVLNDCSCEKCFRTIMTLILTGVDPNTCGFKVDSSTFDTMKEALSRPMSDSRAKTYHVPIQKMIPSGFEFDLSGTKEFFEWYRNFDLKNMGNLRQLRRIYHVLPYPYAQVLDKVYIKCGLHIHEKTTQRT